MARFVARETALGRAGVSSFLSGAKIGGLLGTVILPATLLIQYLFGMWDPFDTNWTTIGYYVFGGITFLAVLFRTINCFAPKLED